MDERSLNVLYITFTSFFRMQHLLFELLAGK